MLMKHYFPVLLLPCDEPKDNPIEAHKILTLVILLVMTCLSQFLALGKISKRLREEKTGNYFGETALQ